MRTPIREGTTLHVSREFVRCDIYAGRERSAAVSKTSRSIPPKILLFAGCGSIDYSFSVSTLSEIQEAVGKLPPNEKTALSMWLDSQITPVMTAQEEEQLLRSLDEAMRDIDAGRGVSIQEAHKLVASWAAK